eukprot:16426961-Heterocapsa_arctica.AAC.1
MYRNVWNCITTIITTTTTTTTTTATTIHNLIIITTTTNTTTTTTAATTVAAAAAAARLEPALRGRHRLPRGGARARLVASERIAAVARRSVRNPMNKT